MLKGKKIRVVKIAHSKNPLHHQGGNFEPGSAHVGVATGELEVGHSLYLETRSGYFVTSTVMQILPNNQFRTLNSIYQYEFVEEKPDNSGDQGLGKGGPIGPDLPQRPRGGREGIPAPHRGEKVGIHYIKGVGFIGCFG